MGRLAASVLDTVNGRPAAGVRIDLFRLDGAGTRTHLLGTTTTDIGRTEPALLEGGTWRVGRYELEFALGDYFRACGTPLADPPFLDVVVVRIHLSDENGDYRVPVIAAPWGYQIYRGS